MITQDPDELVAQRAAETLLTQPRESFVTALAKPDAAPALLRYCAENLRDKPGIADALAKNQNCPAQLVVGVAQHLSTGAVQALMEDLDRLSTAPALAAALAASPSLTAEQRQMLEELQQETSDHAAIEEAVAEAEPDKHRRQNLLTRLARMSVVERVRLAFRGNKEERGALIRDPCKVVQRSVLQSPLVSEREVESFAAMPNVSEEVLRHISLNRNFRKNYTVIRNLVNNPKTPLDASLGLLPNINAQDLKLLTMNKNIPETLRSMAIRLHRQRNLARQGQQG